MNYPRIAVADQQGFATTLGYSQLEATGKRLNTLAHFLFVSDGLAAVLMSNR